jgi:hypothetical protein
VIVWIAGFNAVRPAGTGYSHAPAFPLCTQPRQLPEYKVRQVKVTKTQTEHPMQDSMMDAFVQELKRRGLLERSMAICSSWQHGFVAQDADGEVYAYNTKITARNQGWFCAESTPISKVYRLGQLAECSNWREHVLPMSAIRGLPGGLNVVRQSFYRTLLSEGILGKATAFIIRWQKNAWLAMDANGNVFLFNCRPDQTRCLWMHDKSETCVNYKLDTFSGQPLDWEKCLVKLDTSGLTTQPQTAIDLDIPTRMDCWI